MSQTQPNLDQPEQLLQQPHKKSSLLLLLLSLLVCFAVLLSATSTFFTERAPSLALTINPLNMDARVNFITGELNASEKNFGLDDLAGYARTGTTLSPADARGFSLLGEILERNKDQKTADELYAHALDLSKTEIHALQKKFIGRLKADDAVGAVETLDFILRRWPEQTARFAPFIPALLSRPEGVAKASELFAADYDLRQNVFARLYEKPEWLASAQALMLKMKEDGKIDMRQHFRRLIREYVFARKPYDAFRLFQFTMTPEQRSRSGYVYNSKFLGTPLGHQFDWRFRTQSGVTLEQITTKTDSSTGDPLERHLEITFRDSTVKFNNLHQDVLLPAGEYELNVDLAATNLRTPKPLILMIQCNNLEPPYWPVTKMQIPPGDYERQTLKQNFTVNTKDCPMQQIFMYNETFVSNSRKYRYSGELDLYEIKINRLN